MLTIIIPAFNAEQKIEYTLNSLLNQKIGGFKVIIVDDGSTDNTKEIIEKYTSKLNIVYKYKENGGVSSARNLGVQICDTKYFSFLDSDDAIMPDFTRVMQEAIVRTNANFAYCRYVTTNSQRTNVSVYSEPNRLLLDYTLDKVKLHLSCFIFDSKFIKQCNVQFDKDLNWGEDVEWISKIMARSTKHVSISKPLFLYSDSHSDAQLSSFRLNAIESDHKYLTKLLNDPYIEKNSTVKNAILNYKLPALLSYRLLLAIKKGMDVEEIISYYNQYNREIFNTSFMFNLRSLKLKIANVQLKYLIKTLV